MRLRWPGSALLSLTVLVVVAAMLLGGETRAGFLGDVVVQVLAVPLLLVGATHLVCSDWRVAKSQRIAILVVTSIIAVTLVLQLVPLPSDLWLALGRPPIALTEMITPDASENWRALSLTPNATWTAAASLIVSLAVFLAVMQLSIREKHSLVWVVLAAVGVALFFGYLQVAQGAGSAFRFSSFKNQSEAVGFFANRNHFAALLYTALVFAGVWCARVVPSVLVPGPINAKAVLWLSAALCFLFALFVGLAMSRSRAGILLGGVACVAVIVMIMASAKSSVPPGQASKSTPRQSALWVWPLAVGLAAVVAIEFGLYRIAGRFGDNALDDARLHINGTTIELALQSLPFGAGIGSFVPLYSANEEGIETAAFVNRAHNDFAELVVETGVLGILCIVAFIVWFLVRAIEIWSDRGAQQSNGNNLLQRAATIVILLLLAHSLVDYPLRTTAMSTLFVLCCALLIPSPSTANARRPRQQADRNAIRPAKEFEGAHAGPTSYGLWTTDIELPESWQKQEPRGIRRRRDE